MISTQRRPSDTSSNKSKKNGIAQPLLKSEIFSKHPTPVPPSTSATRHESLSRRSRKIGMLSDPRKSVSVLSVKKSAREEVPKLRCCGLEIRPEQVVFKGWQPGEEYTKNLTLKNVHVKTQKIRYKVPSSRFFSTLFPQAIVLSAGTSFTLPLTFRPLDKEKYEDKIEFTTSSGSFSVPLLALLPETKLHLPDSIHFGLTAVHDLLELGFEIKNMSELTTDYTWQVPEPFSIIPMNGTLSSMASCRGKVSFHPNSANVFEATAVCSYGQNMTKTMKLEGIGKYPHILVSTKSKISGSTGEKNISTTLAFGKVNVHKTSEMFITLHNLSNVKAPFKVEKSLKFLQLDQSFHCPIKSGVISPMGNFRLPITFTPHSVNLTSIDYFDVSAMGSVSKSSLECIGSSSGPKVEVNVAVINFGMVNQGKSSTRTLQISNVSNCGAIYQVLLDEIHSVFTVNCNSGSLPVKGSQTLIVHFNPPHPINYYRRVAIMVHDQGPLFVDFIGTCHTEERKPPLLKPKHLDHYRTHVFRGLSVYPSNILNGQLKEGKLTTDSEGCLMLPSDKLDQLDYKQSPMEEYFDDGHCTEVTHNPPHVSLDQSSVWIGQVQPGTSCHVTLHLTNHTQGKITAMWIEDPTGVFQVQPSTCDIPPMKTTDFSVHFKPNAPNQFFGKELECYVSYKCMRDFRLVEDESVCPPWLLTVDVTAHTFVGSNETFLPEASLSSQSLTFPAVASNENSFKTILIENKGTNPLIYKFMKPQSDRFTIKRAHGLIRSKFHITSLRLTPTEVDTYRSDVTLRLNDNEQHDMSIRLSGSGEQPELLLGNEGEMYFRPTCVLTSNERRYEVHNVGRLPLKFRWHLPHRESQYLDVDPLEGVVESNEIQAHTWRLTPVEVKKYVFKPVCLTWPYKGNNAEYKLADARLFKLRVIGEGSEGEIKAERCNMDLGCVITGTNHSRSLLLYNNSSCDIHFKLSVEQHINSQYGEDPDENEPIGLKLDQSTVLLPARSKMSVMATAHPHRRVLYSWSLFYELLDQAGEAISRNCRILLCEMTAEGVYPTLSIIDARPSGGGSSISKTQLWRWFSLEHLNTCLDSDPSAAELVYSTNSRHSTTRRPSVYTKSIMDFNFGASPVDSEPCHVSVMVKNTGLVDTSWAFIFPKDMELEVDYWAETGAFDPEQLHELHIQDNKLFTIKPSRGVLRPGETRTILLTYKHDVAGTHRLPVLFKIENGKEVLLNFIGVTVQNNRRYLHFPGTKHSFTPVPIGGPTPPKQLYDMYNGGCMSVIYEVDLAPLRELQASNFEHPVLTCLNPRGEIPPGTSANLEWIFSPLESKNYSVDIPIHIIGGPTALISFSGIGYDRRAMGSTMPMLDQPAEFTAVPSTQKVPVPEQLLYLSEERISFGNVPLFSRARHVIFLSNKSLDRPLSFSWHAASPVVNEVLRVEPVRGNLAPGERIMTRIMFCAAGQPSFYDLDLICEVVDEIKMAGYRSELEAWEAERDRQEVEFVITDDDVTSDDVTGKETFELHAGPSKFSVASSPRRNLENVINKHSPSPLRLTESVNSKFSIKSEKKTFQTLPPIRFEDPVKLPSNRSRMLRKEEAVARDEWVQPQAPKPFVCHLGITARTHDIAEFRVNFPKESRSHFVDRNLQVSYPVAARKAEDQFPLTTCNQEEKDLVVGVLSNVLRGLLDDPTFHDDVRCLATEPTPYFGQLAREEELEEEDDGRRSGTPRRQEDAGSVSGSKQGSEVGAGAAQAVVQEVMTPSASSAKLMDEILRQGGSRPSSCGTDRSARDSVTVGRALTAVSSTKLRMVEQEIKRSPEFGSLLEDVLSSTITNIMEEALKGEVILTARPRVVALPPSRVEVKVQRSASTRTGSRASSTGSKLKQLRTSSVSSSTK